MLSLDPNIMHSDRDAGKRMRQYASLTETLTIILFSTGGSAQTTNNLTIYPTSGIRIVSFFKGLAISVRELRKKRYDLITLQEPFILSFIAFPLARLFGLPIEVQVHSTFFSPFWRESVRNMVYQWFGRVFIPKATCIRAVSERIRKDLVKGLDIPNSKISVLPVFLDTECLAHAVPAYDIRTQYPQFDFILLTASRLVRQKNIELAIRAVSALTARYPGLGLIVVGAEPHGKIRYEQELKALSSGFEEHVVFTGWSDDVVSYYKGADVFLLTSNYEGWAMTVIEAMASGTAVIMTAVGCADEVVRNGENGIIIQIGDQAALVAAIERLYTDRKERERLAKAGKRTALALEPHTQEAYLARYKEGWERCIQLYKRNNR